MLLFGLSLSLFVFIKLLRPLVVLQVSQVTSVVYIDDSSCIAIGSEEAKRNLEVFSEISPSLQPAWSLTFKIAIGTFSNLRVARYYNRYS